MSDGPGRWRFDHFNVAMYSPDALLKLFRDVMGLEIGPRPPLSFPGLWLKQEGEDNALVHVTGDRGSPTDPQAVVFRHLAFRTDESAATVTARLREANQTFQISDEPGRDFVQIFVRLPGDFMVELITAR